MKLYKYIAKVYTVLIFVPKAQIYFIVSDFFYCEKSEKLRYVFARYIIYFFVSKMSILLLELLLKHI